MVKRPTIYLHYEEGEQDKHTTLKLKLPGKWLLGNTDRVKEFFLETYNTKFPDDTLDAANVHLENSTGRVLKSNEIVGHVIKNSDDIYCKNGPSEIASDEELSASARAFEAEQEAAAAAKEEEKAASEAKLNGATASLSEDSKESKAGSLRCKNYGCNQWFDEVNNGDTVCKHHVAPPLFHDTKKGWTCCTKRVYDWADFQNIEGCNVGRHDTTDPKVKFAPSPTVAAANAADAAGVASAPMPVTRSIDDYNAANPDAVTAAASAVKTLNTKKITRREDGTARCTRKGCQLDFVVADNHAQACHYHPANPVFHDTGKYWACCPSKVKYDFDEFMTIKGCTVGFHNDGSRDD